MGVSWGVARCPAPDTDKPAPFPSLAQPCADGYCGPAAFTGGHGCQRRPAQCCSSTEGAGQWRGPACATPRAAAATSDNRATGRDQSDVHQHHLHQWATGWNQCDRLAGEGCLAWAWERLAAWLGADNCPLPVCVLTTAPCLAHARTAWTSALHTRGATPSPSSTLITTHLRSLM